VSELESLKAVDVRTRKLARELAEEIAATYTPVFTASHLPTDAGQANERRAQLALIRNRLHEAFTVITAAWTEHPLSRKDLPGVKAPLQKILKVVESEGTLIKDFLRTQSTNDWAGNTSLCLQALTRAINGGFVLSEAEQSAFKHLRSLIPY